MSRFLFLVVMLAVSAESAHAAPDSTRLGGCMIIDVYSGNGPNDGLENACLRMPNPKARHSGRTFFEAFKWAPLILRSAFELAEIRLGGARYSIVGERNVRIHVTDDEFPTATVGSDQYTIYMTITTGLMTMVEGVISSIHFEVATIENGQKPVPGITYSEWLQAFREQAKKSEPFVPFPGARETPPTVFWETRIAASVLYQLIFMHELAHLAYGLDCGYQGGASGNERKTIIESACDEFGMRSFLDEPEEVQMAIFLIPFQLALHYYFEVFSDQIANPFRVADPGELTSSRRDFFAGHWASRVRSSTQFILFNSLDDDSQLPENIRQAIRGMLRSQLSAPTPSEFAN